MSSRDKEKHFSKVIRSRDKEKPFSPKSTFHGFQFGSGVGGLRSGFSGMEQRTFCVYDWSEAERTKKFLRSSRMGHRDRRQTMFMLEFL